MQEFDQDLLKYDRQLKQGIKYLKFSRDLESEFRTFFYTRNVVKQRGAIFVGIILLLILMPLDLAFLDGRASEFYLFTRLWITLPLLIIALIGTYKFHFQRYFSVFSFFIIAFIGLSTNICILYTQNLGQYMPYEGAILLIMVAFFLGGMHFRLALCCAIVVGLSYLLFSELYSMPDEFRWHRYFFLFASTLIGGVSAFTLEYQVRLSFLQRGALKNLAKTDHLTQLYNRGAINQKLNQLVEYAFREKKTITLLLLDVDYFKNFNDCYGHIKGDRCLIAIAQSLVKNCQRPLDFVGRFGGEEFLIMWFDALPNESAAFAEKVKHSIDALKLPHAKSDASKYVSISGGMITGTPTSQDMAEKILNQADQCLYRAKDSGRNRIILQDMSEGNSIAGVVK